MRGSALLALLFLTTAANAQERPASPPPTCAPHADRAAGAKTAGVSKLGDLPDAVELRTVWRMVDGCPKPVVLRDGVGGNPRAAKPPVNGEVGIHHSR